MIAHGPHHLLSPPPWHIIVLGTDLQPTDIPLLEVVLQTFPCIRSYTVDWEDRDRVLRIVASADCQTRLIEGLQFLSIRTYEIA